MAKKYRVTTSTKVTKTTTSHSSVGSGYGGSHGTRYYHTSSGSSYGTGSGYRMDTTTLVCIIVGVFVGMTLLYIMIYCARKRCRRGGGIDQEYDSYVTTTTTTAQETVIEEIDDYGNVIGPAQKTVTVNGQPVGGGYLGFGGQSPPATSHFTYGNQGTAAHVLQKGDYSWNRPPPRP